MHPCRGALLGAAKRQRHAVTRQRLDAVTINGARYRHFSYHRAASAPVCRSVHQLPQSWTANVARECVDRCRSHWVTCAVHPRQTSAVPAFHHRRGLPLTRGLITGYRAFHTNVDARDDALVKVNYNGFHRDDVRGMVWFPTKNDLIAHAVPEHKPIIAERYISYKKGPVFKYAHLETHDQFLELSHKHAPTSFFEVLHEDSPRCLYFDIDSKAEHKAREAEIISTLTKFVEQHMEMDNLQSVVLRNPQAEKMSIHVIFPEVQFPNHLVQCYHVPRLLHDMKRSSDLLDEVVDPTPYSRFQLYRAPFAAKMSKTEGLLVGTTFELATETFSGDPKTMFAGYVNAMYRRRLPVPQPWMPVTLRRYGIRSGISDINCLFQHKFEQPERTGTYTFEGTPVECLRQALKLIHPMRASHWWSWFRMSGIMYRLMHPHYVLPPRVGSPMAWPTPPRDDDGDSSNNAQPVNGGVMLPSKVNALLSTGTTGKSSADAPVEVPSEELLEVFLEWSKKYPTYDRAENLEMVYRCEGRRVSGPWLLSHIVIFDNPNVDFPQLCPDTSKKQEFAIR
eukprot:GEMP01020602.1.p1 GENE.GEMP01020602.1~~GEMP01020602.1.p1  ORF type:complete len:564 (+),score=80.57 GEMP01020602.1:81-1772(+)